MFQLNYYTKGIHKLHNLILKYKRDPLMTSYLSSFMEYWYEERDALLYQLSLPRLSDEEYITLSIY